MMPEDNKIPQKIEEERREEKKYKCEKCKDTGRILTKQGIKICYECLSEGRFDVHSKEIKDTGIKW